MAYTKLSRDTGMPLDYERPGAASPGTLKAAKQWLQQAFDRRPVRTRRKARQQKREVRYARA